MFKLIRLLISLIEKSILGFKYFGNNSIIKFPFIIFGKRYISIGNNVFIAENSGISVVKTYNGKIPLFEIGDNVSIGSNVFVTCIDKIKIENNVLISSRVFIGDNIHAYRDISRPIIEQGLEERGDVLIKEGAFLGINAIIMPGVTIGKNSVVGAGTVVTHNIPDFSVVVGNPGKIIKKYSFKNRQWLNVK